ncbi:variant surface glycoprotein (VSG, atypical), putative [Trypanosoma brucei brucei TREU927]|uniref:Variant surface glycoprotein (VSG, atypical), putative n=1 Tax=Trypanosoma brucei brucei (strain 927/4 GUTat10.1) TaxID=185431 RepID=Q57TR9_TRYB2|nr:variant surface glycoprotein (VSG, atypical), putative [Trypanosoma brucei brucei TREU927]AAX81076.1 variant surface glycoprotein (VSG, atypical), putative [Trypanosoma brucei]AAZ10084.1 variant surface glycoprotein (VSG, atypical), putative [Trypanosoma brucei brucei TREU927]
MDCQNRAAIALVQWKTATTVAVALLYVAVTASASYEVLDFTTWPAHCSLAVTLRKVHGGMLTKLESQISYRNKLEEMEAKLRIYGLKGATAEEQTTVELLAETAALMRVSKQNKEQTNLQTAVTAVGFASEGAAAISSYLMTIDSLTHNTQTYCLSDSAAELSPTGCRHGKSSDYEAGNGPDNDDIVDSGFTKIAGQTNTANTGKKSKCGLFRHEANPESNGGIFITAASSKPSFGYGMLKIEAEDQSTGLKLSGIKARAGDEDQKFWSSCHAAVKAAQDMQDEPPLKVDQTLLAVLVGSTEMQYILKLEAAASQQKGPEEVTIDLASAKKTYFGSDNNKLEPLWTKIKGENIVDLTNAKGTTKELGTVTDTTELHKLLSYYYTVRKERQRKTAEQVEKLETELADQKDKSPESECNKISDEPKCNDEKICSWHKEVKAGEKNCQFNSKKAKEKGISVTQTQTVGGTETTTDKCKDKKKANCKDSCKWEGETCKESSILVNKKFALSAAAFAALLF